MTAALFFFYKIAAREGTTLRGTLHSSWRKDFFLFFFFYKKSRDWTVSNKRFIFMSRFDLFILFGCVRFRLGTSFQAGGNIAPEKYRKYFSRIALFFSSINGTRHCWRSSPRITVSNQLPCSPIHALANAVQLYTFQSR